MFRPLARSPAMTIATFRFDNLMFHAPKLMFYLPGNFQTEESPALIEARIKARQWMQQQRIVSVTRLSTNCCRNIKHKLHSGAGRPASHTENME